MNLQALYDLKERLEYAAIAGTGLLQEDFRLHRAVEAMTPLAGANPVFAKIAAAAKALLTAAPAQRGTRLLDVLSLVDAVVYTQGVSGVPGELTPMEPGSGTYAEVSYGQLQPLLAALSSSGSGRMELIQDTYRAHPAYFGDFRVLPHVVKALGDNYAELAELMTDILLKQGPAAVPLLKAGFDPAGKKEMARRVYLVASLAGGAENEWFVRMLPDSKRDVREAIIQALGLCRENGPLLRDLCRSERGKAKEAALRSLIMVNDEAALPMWQKLIAKNIYEIRLLEGADSTLAADLTAAAVQAQVEKLLHEADRRDSFHILNSLMRAAWGKYSEQMARVWHWIGENMEHLHQIPMDETKNYIELSVAQWMQYSLMKSILIHPAPGMLALARSLARENRDWFLCCAFGADLLEMDPGQLYDAYGSLLRSEERVQILRGLAAVTWDPERRAYCTRAAGFDPLNGQHTETVRTLEGMDPRWLTGLMDEAIPDDGGIYVFGEEVWRGIHEPAREWLLGRLIDPTQPALCEQLAQWFCRRFRETGIGTEAVPALMKCGWTDWKGLFLGYRFADKELTDQVKVLGLFERIPMANADRLEVMKAWAALIGKNKYHAAYRWLEWKIPMLEAQMMDE